MIVGCRGMAWSELPLAVGAGATDRRKVHGARFCIRPTRSDARIFFSSMPAGTS
jgi:hypothetical protein